MVDFNKRLSGKKASKPVDPVALYDTLDRAHDKGPLRPAQVAVLSEWHAKRQTTRDVIVKLHTGQGKTLIGLLMLQSRLNETKGPAVYLCPDNFLIDQTCTQGKEFGITTCKAVPDLPDAFLNGEQILVTSVQKLFNGLTRFGLWNKSIRVGALLMDDAHACSDIIREQCRLRIGRDEPAYDALLTLFAAELEQQGVGTFADIRNDKRDALLPVPYWAWMAHEGDVAHILSSNAARNSLKYAWPLLRDILGSCQAVVSGAAIEIEPSIPPLNAFGSYWDAGHRIFMSATVTDDAFLVKGIRLNPDTISNPLTYAKERWSGEKMVLLPSLINAELDRARVVKGFGVPNAKRQFGVVALAPSFNWTKDWESYGATIATKDTVASTIDVLRNKQFAKAVVLVNRYDGIDLPDDTCRILIFDGRPYSESLIDLYQESCRPHSEATLMRTVRTIEQGMGRRLLANPFYAGVVTWHELECPGAHPSLIDRELFDKVQAVIARRFANPGPNGSVLPGFPLRGLALCSSCRGRMTCERHGTSLYYRCSRQTYRRDLCPGRSCNAKRAHDGVERLCRQLRLEKSMAEQIRQAAVGVIAQRLADEKAKRHSVDQQTAELLEQEMSLTRGFSAGDIAPNQFNQDIAVLRTEREQLAELVTTAPKSAADLAEDVARTLQYATSLWDLYAPMNEMNRRTLLNGIFKTIVLDHHGVAGFVLNPPFDVLMTEGSKSKSARELVDHVLDAATAA